MREPAVAYEGDCMNELGLYVVFDDEPGTFVICICIGEQSNINIVYSDLDDDEWRRYRFMETGCRFRLQNCRH